MTSLQRILNRYYLPIFIVGIFTFLFVIGLSLWGASSVKAEFAALPTVIREVSQSPVGMVAALEPTATRPAPPVTATSQPVPTATVPSPPLPTSTPKPSSGAESPSVSPTVTPTATLIPILPMSGGVGVLKIQVLLVVFFGGCILLGLVFGVISLNQYQ